MRKHQLSSKLALALALVVALLGSVSRAAVWPSGREAVNLAAEPFDLRDVRLLDGPFRDAMLRDSAYLHDLESDRLLWYFRREAGLPTPGKPLGGWEKTALRGHTMGHYLSACALMYASTGDEKLKAKADAIVAELAKCQKKIGTGYLSAYPEKNIDLAIAQQRVWAPWYTLHKIFAGLIDMHAYCGNEQALEVAQGMATWAKGKLDPLDRKAMQGMLDHTEQGGMNDALANLYGQTGDPRWLTLSERFDEDAYNAPLVEHRDRLAGQHANSFIPNMVGTARQYELTGDTTDRHIAEFFWRIVAQGRSYCTGGTSVDEGWRGAPYHLANYLSTHTQENCCTYNMLKLTRHLFAWEPRAEYFDYYERNLFSSILSTQDPQTGMMTYFVTMAPGRWKYFNTPRNSFWCCTGTGMENHSKYGDSIYFHKGGTLWVNLFVASELQWKDQGVTVRQETQFPESDTTALVLQTAEPKELELRMRVPHWATDGVTLKVNGQPQEVTAQPGSYLSVRRTWRDGDRVEMKMPMRLWLCPTPDDESLAAIMYGPMVLAGELGEVDAPTEMVYTTENWFHFPEDRIADEPVMVTADRDPSTWVKPVDGEVLVFRTTGVGRPSDVKLVPYYRLWNQKYAIYWRLTDEAGWERLRAEREARRQARAHEAARRVALEKIQLDSVAIGEDDSEQAHNLESKESRDGERSGFRWRDAGPGGWFEYRMKVVPDAPAVLLCRYWGSDGGRTFDVLVDGTRIATQTLSGSRPEEFFDVEYEIPTELTEGKQSAVVRFVPHDGSRAGGLYRLSIHKAQP